MAKTDVSLPFGYTNFPLRLSLSDTFETNLKNSCLSVAFDVKDKFIQSFAYLSLDPNSLSPLVTLAEGLFGVPVIDILYVFPPAEKE